MSDSRLRLVRGDGPGILLLDPEGRVRFVNESARSLLRLRSHPEVGCGGTSELQDTLSLLRDPEHRDRPRVLLGLRHDREDGSECRVNVEIQPLESGETTVLFHDPGPAPPSRLSSPAELHRLAFEHAEVGMALVEAGSEFRVLEPNPALLHLLGAGADTLVGEPLPMLFARSREAVAQLRFATESRERAVALVHPREGGGVLRMTAALLPGAPERILCTLEPAPVPPGGDGFLSLLNHELRTPLYALSLNNELLLSEAFGELSSPQAEAVLRSQRAVQQLQDLMNELRDFMQMGTREDDLLTEEFQVADLLRDLLAPLSAGAPGEGVLCDYVDAGPVRSDPQRLRQILLQLLAQARHPAALRPVEVRCAQGAGGEVVVVDVTDHGRPLSPADLDRLFEPFAHLPGKRQGRTGLGLSLARRTAELLGGTLTAASSPAGVTTLRLQLPRRPSP